LTKLTPLIRRPQIAKSEIAKRQSHQKSAAGRVPASGQQLERQLQPRPPDRVLSAGGPVLRHPQAGQLLLTDRGEAADQRRSNGASPAAVRASGTPGCACGQRW